MMCRLLMRVGKRDKFRVIKCAAQQFDADGKAIRRKAGGHANRGESRRGAELAGLAALRLANPGRLLFRTWGSRPRAW